MKENEKAFTLSEIIGRAISSTLVLAASAHAATSVRTIPYSCYFDSCFTDGYVEPIRFTQFDSSLGNLNWVTFTFDVYYRIRQTMPESIDLTALRVRDTYNVASGYFQDSESVLQEYAYPGAFESFDANIQLHIKKQLTSDHNFFDLLSSDTPGPYISAAGYGSFTTDVSSPKTGWIPLNDPGNDLTWSGTGTAMFTYNYTPIAAVPEFPIWILMAGGLAFVAHARLRQK